MVALLNTSKLSFKKPGSTTALKGRLLGFRQVASDKPQGTLLKGGGFQRIKDIRTFILYAEIWIKNSTNFC